MKYIINFQIQVTLKNGNQERLRSTYTIDKKEIVGFSDHNFNMINEWFINYFHKNPLENFVNVSKIDQGCKVEIKIGRITNTISGEYKTF